VQFCKVGIDNSKRGGGGKLQQLPDQEMDCFRSERRVLTGMDKGLRFGVL